MYNCISIGKIQVQMLTHGYQGFLVPDIFQNIMSKLAQAVENVQTYLDDFDTNS
jgi:hypothetical protein